MEITPLTGKALTSVQYATARLNICEGSVRSGKTIGTLLDWIRFCRQGPQGNLLMVGRTERTVINNLLIPMQEMLGRDRVKINHGMGTADVCGRKVMVIGANNEQARTKIQGLTLAGAYVDEAATLPESFWNMLVSRLSVAGARLWATCNPEGPQNWFKKNWLDKAKLWVDHDGIHHDRQAEFDLLAPDDEDRPLDLHRFSFTLDDNAHNLDPEYVASTKGMYSGLWYQRMILGHWSVAEGMVFDAYDPVKHVVDTLPEIVRVPALGIDVGTTSPSAGIMLGVGADHRLYLMAEWAPKTGTTDAYQAQDLIAWQQNQPEPDYRFVDSAAASFKLELQERRVPRVFNADKAISAGVKLVNSLFSTDQLRVHSSCINFQREAPGYVWDAKKSDEGTDQVQALNDHWCDAARYALFSSRRFWTPYLRHPVEEVAA